MDDPSAVYWEVLTNYVIDSDHVNARAVIEQAGAMVDAPNPVSGETPLMIAVQNQDTGMVRLLLEHGANSYATSNAGVSPNAIAAAQDPSTGIAVLLLEAAISASAYNPSPAATTPPSTNDGADDASEW